MHRYGDGIEFGIIAMGRYGGASSASARDADVMYVYRAAGVEPRRRSSAPSSIVHELMRLTEDLRVPLDLDIGLRPEGKNGAIVRSLDSYRAYYERWSLTWEAQALLRRTRRGRRRRRCSPTFESSPTMCATRRRSATRTCARSSASRRASSPSGCRRAPTRPATSSSAAGR